MSAPGNFGRTDICINAENLNLPVKGRANSRARYHLEPVKHFSSFTLVAAIVAVMLVALGSTILAQDDDTQHAVAIFNHAQDLHEKGDLAAAIAEYDKALKLFKEFPEAEYQRAVAELALGNIAEAEGSLRRAVELRQDWSLAWGTLGDAL